jgi:hypothetical protein
MQLPQWMIYVMDLALRLENSYQVFVGHADFENDGTSKTAI